MTRIRPWIFCFIFFIIANIGFDQYFSAHGTDLYKEENLVKRATYYTEKEIRKLLCMIEADPHPKVVIIGDSYLWGTGVNPNQLASEQLKTMLAAQYPDLHVWNVALPASHAADVYAMIKTILPMKPTALIVNTNYYFFTIPEDRNHMTQKWMLPTLAEEAEYDSLLDALQINAFEMKTKTFLQSIIPIYRHKEEVNLKLLGHTTGQDYITAQIARVYATLKRYSPIALPAGERTYESYRDFYDPHIITEDQINVIYAKKIAQLLDQADVPTYLFSTPQNPNALGPLIENDIFDSNMQMIDEIYSGQRFHYENLHGQIDPKLQMDNIHLTPAGHTYMAELLYDRLTQLLAERGGTPQ